MSSAEVLAAARSLRLVRLTSEESHSAEARRRIRAGELYRIRQGIYREGGGSAVALTERVVAALLVLPPGSLAFALTAARLWRLEPLPRYDDGEVIDLAVPRGVRKRLDGCRLHQVGALDCFVLQRVPTCSLAAAAVTAPVGWPFPHTLALVESALRGPASRDALQLQLASLPPTRGVATIRRAVSHAGRLSETPLESMMRAVIIEAGLPEPLQQAVILDRGRFLARVDFLWPEAMLVVEVDGLAKYGDPAELLNEKRRQNRLVAAGYTVLRFTWDDVLRHPDETARSIRTALGG